MRRQKLLVALVVLAVVVAAGVVVLWPQPLSLIRQENYERIKVGMSRAEVEAILGPPRPFSMDGDVFEGGHYIPYDENGRLWRGAAGVITVTFENDRAVSKAWAPPAGPLTRLRRWWERWGPLPE
jgi:hypothetical protein